MSHDVKGFPARLSRLTRLIAITLWIAAGVSVPPLLILRDYESTLLILVTVVAWHVGSALVSSLVPRAAPRATLRFHYRLTPWGLVYCCIGLTFCFASLQWGMNLIYLTAAFLLALGVCAVVFPAMMLRQASVDWDKPEHVFAGSPFPMEVAVRNQRTKWGGLSAFGLKVSRNGRDGLEPQRVHIIRRLAPGQERSVLLRQYSPERGMQRLHPVTIATRFPFGMVEAAMEIRSDREVLVLPRMGFIRQEALLHHKAGEARWLLELRRRDQQGEFQSLREYKPGDNPRHIHWVTSARLHKLYVREFERREINSVLILLDSFAPPETADKARARLERYEKAVSFAASMAALLTERNVFYAFASYCPDLNSFPYDSGQGHLYSLLEALALAGTTSEHTVADLAAAVDLHRVGAGGVCLITPGPLSAGQRESVLGPLAGCSVSIDVSEPEFDEIFVT